MAHVSHANDYEVDLTQPCQASAEAVYALLADLRSHLLWGGKDDAPTSQHLLSMDAPEGLAVRGSEFTTIGHTSGGEWHDRSRVTRAEPPHLFEFATQGSLRDPEGFERLIGTWAHRYELIGDDDGCVIRYSCRARISPCTPPGAHHPHHPPRLPLVMYKLVIPGVMERGLRNLAVMARDRAYAER